MPRTLVDFQEMVKEAEFKMQRVNRVPMFRTGDYGEKGKYSTEDLDAMAASYDPNYLAGPITCDHVQTGPALGWIVNVYREGDMLMGDWDLHPDTVKDIKEGKFVRRSVEFYRKHTMPDGRIVPYVKACSILGAATPHAKGMPNIQFNEEEQFLEFDFDPQTVEDHNTLTFKEVNTMPQGNGKFTSMADAEAEIARLSQALEAKDSEVSSLAEKNEELSRTNQQLDTRLSTTEQMTQKLLADAKKAAAKTSFDDVLKECREQVSPVQEAYLRAMYYHLYDAPEDAQLAFTAPGSKEATQVHPAELVLEYMRNSPKVVEFGDPKNLNGQRRLTASKMQVDMSDPEQAQAYNERLVARTEEIQKENPSLSYTDCMMKAEKELRG